MTANLTNVNFSWQFTLNMAVQTTEFVNYPTMGTPSPASIYTPRASAAWTFRRSGDVVRGVIPMPMLSVVDGGAFTPIMGGVPLSSVILAAPVANARVTGDQWGPIPAPQ